MAVFLKHTTKTYPYQKHYFYEGETESVNGVIEIPMDRPHWAQRVFRLGFRIDPETGRELTYGEITDLFSAKSTPTPPEVVPVVDTPVVDESAKSEGANVKKPATKRTTKPAA